MYASVCHASRPLASADRATAPDTSNARHFTSSTHHRGHGGAVPMSYRRSLPTVVVTRPAPNKLPPPPPPGDLCHASQWAEQTSVFVAVLGSEQNLDTGRVDLMSRERLQGITGLPDPESSEASGIGVCGDSGVESTAINEASSGRLRPGMSQNEYLLIGGQK